MTLLSAFLFALSSSLDAFLVGFTWGLRKIRISKRLADLAGSIILIGIGIFYIIKSAVLIYKSRLSTGNSTNMTSFDQSGAPLTGMTLVSMGTALSVNNLGIGISASMTGLPLLPAAICTFLCSVLLLLLGCNLGHSRYLKLTKHLADPICGLLLIVLGICRLL